MSDAEDARAERRRWITLAEGVAVAGVVIGGLTLWNNVSERRSAEAERIAERASSAKAKAALAIVATPESDGERLVLSASDRRIERIEVIFPPVLKVSPKSAVGDVAIAADWIRAPVLAITDGGADALEGRLPVAITATWWDGDRQLRSSAIYDLVFTTHGRLVGGRSLGLKALARREAATGGIGRRLDTLWGQELGRLAG
ncbi:MULTISPECIES: hypothetical protein [unclassified Sphingomonas]|uniref:hypothetical protein n=1 Tax=unclassified Sphingomonas TaxID=196159 RepID=UPI0006FEF9FE|nr:MULTISPECIES: hypothetical protein [unclassified Sphingomonas]KQM67009.1 hypothetical protein ASE65_02880 [Sphingomonas sp. Leaf16]KQN17956.1 hypothetical protein ASE81_02260 [Sphingomonas sp. Leaf29]KQN23819.1 hypothetical protein ASE83_05140 [Sphingomonas sp. Leaf32]